MPVTTELQRQEQTESRPAVISLSGNPGLQKPHRRSACSQADRISGFACTNTHCWEKQSSKETEPSLKRAGFESDVCAAEKRK